MRSIFLFCLILSFVGCSGPLSLNKRSLLDGPPLDSPPGPDSPLAQGYENSSLSSYLETMHTDNPYVQQGDYEPAAEEPPYQAGADAAEVPEQPHAVELTAEEPVGGTELGEIGDDLPHQQEGDMDPAGALDDEPNSFPQEGSAASARSDSGDSSDSYAVPAQTPDGSSASHGSAVAEELSDQPDESAEDSSQNWLKKVEKVALLLEEKLHQDALDDSARLQLQQRLLLARLLAADWPASGEQGEANVDDPWQFSWGHQLDGLAAMLQEGDPELVSVAALQHLRDAGVALTELAPLELPQLAFCHTVESYGMIHRFSEDSFRPRQEVLLYVEVQNFRAEDHPDGFETELIGRYEILDAAGQTVFDAPLPTDRQVSQNRRQDYFIAYRLFMPQLTSGRYSLRLELEDGKSGKLAGRSIGFRVDD